MVRSKIGRVLVNLLLATVLSIAFIGCPGQGDTDGGSATDGINVGDQVNDDGGFGASLKITVFGSLGVGGEVDFNVTVLDPRGVALEFIRLFCESELGIAILEPSSGGVAFFSTGPNGIASGRLGGLTAGSFVLECRATQGFNLVDRVTIVISGSGAASFPGAAGGNLGGGSLVEVSDIMIDGDEVGITSITFNTPNEATAFGPIDIVFNPDCDPDTAGAQEETFVFNSYNVTITNQSAQRLVLSTVAIAVGGALPYVFPVQALPGEVPAGPGGTFTFSGPFTEFSGGSKVFIGSLVPIPFGTVPVTFTVTIIDQGGSAVSFSATTTVTFAGVNNCGV